MTTTLHPLEGQRKLSERDYRKFMELLNELDFDNIPRLQYIPMTDGASWCIERRIADSFKANFTNLGGKKHDALYSYLISLAGIEADYVSEYCHW